MPLLSNDYLNTQSLVAFLKTQFAKPLRSGQIAHCISMKRSIKYVFFDDKTNKMTN
jgi:hypothetical protein